VVAPYRTATGLGVVARAQWYCRPVIASDASGLAETVEDRRTGWIFPAGDAEALSVLLYERVTREAADAMGPALEQALKALFLAAFAEALVAPAQELPPRAGRLDEHSPGGLGKKAAIGKRRYRVPHPAAERPPRVEPPR